MDSCLTATCAQYKNVKSNLPEKHNTRYIPGCPDNPLTHNATHILVCTFTDIRTLKLT